MSVGQIAERICADFILDGRPYQRDRENAQEWVCDVQLIRADQESVVGRFTLQDSSHLDLAVRLT